MAKNGERLAKNSERVAKNGERVAEGHASTDDKQAWKAHHPTAARRTN